MARQSRDRMNLCERRNTVEWIDQYRGKRCPICWGILFAMDGSCIGCRMDREAEEYRRRMNELRHTWYHDERYGPNNPNERIGP